MPRGTPLDLPPRSERTWLTTTEMLAETKATYRQITHWCNQGYIEGQGGPGSGHRRQWMPEQVERVKEILTAIRQAGDIFEAAGLSRRWTR